MGILNRIGLFKESFRQERASISKSKDIQKKLDIEFIKQERAKLEEKQKLAAELRYEKREYSKAKLARVKEVAGQVIGGLKKMKQKQAETSEGKLQVIKNEEPKKEQTFTLGSSPIKKQEFNIFEK